MKRINLTILTVFIMVFVLSINTINCSAAEPYFTDLVEASLCTQEAMDMYDYYLSSDIVASYLDEINSYEHVIVYCDIQSNQSRLKFYCFNDDIVIYKYNIEGTDVIGAISKSENLSCKFFSFRTHDTLLNPDGSLQVKYDNSSVLTYSETSTINNIVYSRSNYYYGLCNTKGVVRCDVPVYQNINDAASALEGNDIRPLYACVWSFSDNDIYFNDFRVVPHISSDFNSSYFDICFELSDYAVTNIKNMNLVIGNDYIIDVQDEIVGGTKNRTYAGDFYIVPLDVAYYGVKVYLNQIPCLKKAVEDGVPGHDIVGVQPAMINEIIQSKLFMEIYLRFDAGGQIKQGKRNDYSYDFVAKASDYSVWIPTTDTAINGDFDYTQEGSSVISNSYYYNEVTTSESGDTVNKYYYVDNGKKIEITENEYNNNSYNVDVGGGDSGGGSGGSSSAEGGGAIANATVGDVIVNVGSGAGDYVNISPKDYKLFVDNVKDMLEELDTGGGLFLLLKDVYGLFPASIWLIVGGGLSSVVIVSIVKILRG